jgi:hypothetical protein
VLPGRYTVVAAALALAVAYLLAPFQSVGVKIAQQVWQGRAYEVRLAYLL